MTCSKWLRCWVVIACVTRAHAQACGGAASLLRTDYRADAPALGVRAAPHFSWVVPPSAASANAVQEAYRIVVSPLSPAAAPPAWDSGRVVSTASVAVPFGGAKNFSAGGAYTWSVTVWLSDGAACPPSAAAAFSVALDGVAWAPGAAWIVAATPAAANQYSFVRKEVPAPAAAGDVALAVLHAAALTDTVLLGFRAFVGGALVGVGPGRGEAPVWGGDGTFRPLVCVSLNATAAVRASAGTGSLALAAVAIGSLRSNTTRGVLLQLDVHYTNGSIVSTATDATWSAFDADGFVRPTLDTSGLTAYAHALEFTDARLEPLGWRESGYAGGPGWVPAVPVQRAVDALAAGHLTPTMAAPLQLSPPRSPMRVIEVSPTLGFIDFGREFQGGAILTVVGGGAELDGTRVTLVAGEVAAPNLTVGFTWGYNFTWTLRAGSATPQTIEQLSYMEFRYLNVLLEAGSTVALAAISVSAWGVSAPWVGSETAFNSSNATLNAVWELSRYTLEAGVVETYTDSNTRERRPYEADGLIATTSRAWLQSDVLWARHSHTVVLNTPTWPVEWQQMTIWLAWADYMATGSTEFVDAWWTALLKNTHYADIDATGLLNTTHGRHIVDWYPGPTREMFRSSEHFSVTTFFALGGLRKLALLAAAAGNPARAAQASGLAKSLQAAVTARMTLGGSGDLCDGICDDPAVANHTGVTTAAWGLFCGVTQPAGMGAAFSRLASWGLENFGDYGAFVHLGALSAVADGDDGTATLTALTKCDAESWCDQINEQGCTMTRETPIRVGTFSHAWGTAPIAATASGLLGITQTAPAWAAFTVKPRLGSLRFASLTVPTLRGPVAVDANATHTAVRVPCGAVATLCARRMPNATTLLLDGDVADAAAVSSSALHVCVAGVGCGAAGAVRVVTAV